MRTYISGILNILLNISDNPEADKRLKKTALLVYNDSLLFCKDEASNYLSRIFQVYDLAIKLVLDLPTPNVRKIDFLNYYLFFLG